MGYMTNFIVYVFAMAGVIMLALFVFKQTTSCKIGNRNGKSMKVLDTLALNPRKTLYIIAVGQEKFLIAGDTDRTTLISKLNTEHSPLNDTKTLSAEILDTDCQTSSFKATVDELASKRNYMDRSVVGITSSKTSPYDSVMKNLAERIRS